MEELYTVYQVAKALKVHPITIRRYIREGKLKARRAGGNIRIASPDLSNFTRDFIPRIKPVKEPSLAQANFSFNDPLFRLKARGLGMNQLIQKG